MSIKKFYWLKLQKDFFKRHDVMILESMPNGVEYILFYLKLLVESITYEGELRFSDTVPYDMQMLSVITRTNIDIVRAAIKIFVDLQLMEILDDGTIYMLEVNKMLGSETEWAKKKREYRDTKRLSGDISETKKDNVRQELEKEKEIELEIDKDKKNNVDDVDKPKSEVKKSDSSQALKFASDFSSPEFKATKYLIDAIVRNDPKAKVPKPETRQFENWAKQLDLLHRSDHRSWDEIKQVIDFCQNDSFWRANVQSAKKLRDKFSQLYLSSKKAKPTKCNLSYQEQIEAMKGW